MLFFIMRQEDPELPRGQSKEFPFNYVSRICGYLCLPANILLDKED